MKANIKIRELVFDSGLTYREIAKCLHVRHEYICRIMKKPLSRKNRERILLAIIEICNEKGIEINNDHHTEHYDDELIQYRKAIEQAFDKCISITENTMKKLVKQKEAFLEQLDIFPDE